MSAHDEWPAIGAALGFPQVAGGDAGQPPRCRSVIAHRLQLLYNDVLRHFDLVENPGSAEAASNALDAILRSYPSAPDMDDPMMAPDINFGDLPPTSPPHPIGHDIFADNVNYSAFNDPTSELVTAWSTNTNLESAPESASDDSDQDHPHTGRAGPSPQISGAGLDDAGELLRPAMWKDIASNGTMFRKAEWWKWKGHMVLDQPRAISTSNVEAPTP